MPAATVSRSDGKSAPRTNPSRPFRNPTNGNSSGKSDSKPEPKILYQSFFKSVGTRTYVSQVKEAGTGNHFILLTEGNRDKQTGEVIKKRVIIFGEDFEAFFKLVTETASFVRKNPVPEDVARKQAKFWEKQHSKSAKGAAPKVSSGIAESMSLHERRGRLSDHGTSKNSVA